MSFYNTTFSHEVSKAHVHVKGKRYIIGQVMIRDHNIVSTHYAV